MDVIINISLATNIIPDKKEIYLDIGTLRTRGNFLFLWMLFTNKLRLIEVWLPFLSANLTQKCLLKLLLTW